jgi:hypothetical protein
MLRAKKCLCAVAGECFDAVRVFLPAIIASPRIALRIFVGEGRAEQRQDFRKGIILGRDEFETRPLAALLSLECEKNFIVGLRKLRLLVGCRHLVLP